MIKIYSPLFKHFYNSIIFLSLRWTKWKFLVSIPDEPRSSSSLAVGKITHAVINASYIKWCFKLPVTAGFWIYNFSQRILERVFVGNIINIRNDCLFSGFLGNESEHRTNKLPENCFAVHTICLSCGQIHFPWTKKKRHSIFNNKESFSLNSWIATSMNSLQSFPNNCWSFTVAAHTISTIIVHMYISVHWKNIASSVIVIRTWPRPSQSSAGYFVIITYRYLLSFLHVCHTCKVQSHKQFEIYII